MEAGNGASVGSEPMLVWFIKTLSWGGIVVGVTALVALLLTLIVVSRGKRATAGAALVFIVPMPFLVSLFCILKGMIASFRVLAITNAEIKASEFSGAIAETLALPFFGLISMAPSYLLAMLFLVGRSLNDDSNGPNWLNHDWSNA